jgi:antitoxin component YwqK of YwqJK toxin-antitoxin module
MKIDWSFLKMSELTIIKMISHKTKQKNVLLNLMMQLFIFLFCFSCSNKPALNSELSNLPQTQQSAIIQASNSNEQNKSQKPFDKYQIQFNELVIKSGFQTEFYKSSPNCKGRLKAELPQGLWICHSINGKKYASAWVLKGRLSGWFRTWANDGSLESESFWQNGRLNGPAIMYFQNGTRAIVAKFKDNLLDGFTIERDENNRKIWSSFFKKGYQDGRERIFYLNGFMKNRSYYIKGKKSGSYTEWYESGNMKLSGQYSEDRPTGIWSRWEDDKNTKSKSGTFEMIHAEDH